MKEEEEEEGEKWRREDARDEKSQQLNRIYIVRSIAHAYILNPLRCSTYLRVDRQSASLLRFRNDFIGKPVVELIRELSIGMHDPHNLVDEVCARYCSLLTCFDRFIPKFRLYTRAGMYVGQWGATRSDGRKMRLWEWRRVNESTS